MNHLQFFFNIFGKRKKRQNSTIKIQWEHFRRQIFFEKYFYEILVENDVRTEKSNYVADNFGVANSDIELLKNSKLGQESLLIDHDFIYKYYKSEGWIIDLEKEDAKWDYLPVEQFK